MKTNPADLHVDVQSLRVGMYIHLDLGWMSHPFPLGSFKLTSADQIETIRSLGLKQLRWSPERSDAEVDPLRAGLPRSAALDAAAAEPVIEPVVAETPEAAARRERREALLAQREAQQLCERQFNEASLACRLTFDLAMKKPEDARAHAEGLTRALLDKMLGDHEVSIRVLSENAGDKAALHALNVGIISLLMGRVFGLTADDLLDLGVGALLHDIGKADLPERVRHKDEHFTPTEVLFYQEHVARGVSAGRRMGLRAGALLVIGQHHEHADGTGFPLHLTSDRMTIAARVLALVNRYDNLCNPNVPSKALTPHESLSLLFAQGKNKFDSAIMSAFIRMMGVYPPGSTVQLTDDRYALVTAVNSSRPLKPRVLVHDPRVPRDEALLLDLERHSNLGIRRSVKPQTLPAAALEYLAPRQRIVYFFEPARALEPVPRDLETTA